METNECDLKPYVADEVTMKEFTPRAIVLGCIFGILFGAASVYLALRAGLTIAASIPVAVLSITLGSKFLKTTILENNIIQTTASAGGSIASGIVFTLTGFLFLSIGQNNESVGGHYFNYVTIFTLASIGGVLGVLMMIPLRRSLMVKEHNNLPYPEGSACASVLIAGDKGGEFAKTAYQGLGFAAIYAMLQLVLGVIASTPKYVTQQTNKWFPSATFSGTITPEYLGVGYIIGFHISGILVAGGVLSWLGIIPLLAGLLPMDTIAQQLVKLGYLTSITTAGGPGVWDPATHTFGDTAEAIYRAYVRQIGAGAVAAGGFMTVIKTIPTIVSSFRDSLSAFKNRADGIEQSRTSRDLTITTVVAGCAFLLLCMVLMPQLPGDSFVQKLLIGILVIVFGFFFVTVSSRIVGLIGASSNPVSGMTIATLMATSLVFIGSGLTGKLYEPLVLVVGGLVCLAASAGGATSQDLKTGHIVGATPRLQQMGLVIGCVIASVTTALVVGWLDHPSPDMVAQGIVHAIGSDKFPAPQGTLMATLIRGLLSLNLDWNFVLVGAALAITIELCGVNALNFAVGAYLPINTTLPIFAGGCIRKFVEWTEGNAKKASAGEAAMGKGSLFATGLVAGGSLAGVIVALLNISPAIFEVLKRVSFESALTGMLGSGGYQALGLLFFVLMGVYLFYIAVKKDALTVTESAPDPDL
jgi:putative OPT family oligopeptide transporter